MLTIVNVFVSEDVTIPESSSEIIMYQLAVISDGLTAANNEAMLDLIK